MKKVLRKSNLVAGILILVVVCVGIVLAGDVIVKEGTLEAENINATGTIEGGLFKSTGCTATGTRAVAFGDGTEAIGNYSTAMGYDTEAIGPYGTAMGRLTTADQNASTAMGYYTTASGNISTAMGVGTTASGDASTAMGWDTTASGHYSTAMGYGTTAGPAYLTTAIGESFTNDVESSFAVGFGQKDFSVVSGLVTVGNAATLYGDLVVGRYVDANDYLEHSGFYDKDTYGSALNYSEDSSRTIKLNAQGKKEYNHEADPVFLQKWVTVTDYDKYTEEEVWDDVLNKTITRRIYETHQELRSDLGMKAAWLRQCVFELKQENQMLKDEIARLKEAVGIE